MTEKKEISMKRFRFCGDDSNTPLGEAVTDMPLALSDVGDALGFAVPVSPSSGESVQESTPRPLSWDDGEEVPSSSVVPLPTGVWAEVAVAVGEGVLASMLPPSTAVVAAQVGDEVEKSPARDAETDPSP